MELRTPHTAKDLEAIFGPDPYPDEDGDHVFPVGAIPPGMMDRLAELNGVLAEEATVTVARDWERCPFAMIDGDPRFDVLAFTEDGDIAFGGVNQPYYFDNVRTLLIEEAARHTVTA